MGKKQNKRVLTAEERAAIQERREAAKAKRAEKELAEKQRIAAEKRKKNIITSAVAALVVLAIVLSIVLAFALRTEACEYLETRDTAGRDIHYVKIVVKDYGDIVLLLDATTAPITVENFLNLASSGFYDGLTFHRVMENFMIQGGDPLANGLGGSSNKIKGEFDANGHENDISHIRGVISMARSSDSYDSASSQFFICNADSVFLDKNYAAFGYVISGLSVVDKITRKTVKYADASSGTIDDVYKQAIIETITEIPAEQAAKYLK